MRRGVVLLVGGEKEIELVRALDAPGTGLTVTRRCADTAELLAAVAAGVAQVAVIDTSVHGVDLGLIARTEDAGVRVIVLTGVADTNWHRASVQVPAHTPAARVLHAITAAIAQPAQVGVGEPPLGPPPPPRDPSDGDSGDDGYFATRSAAGGDGVGAIPAAGGGGTGGSGGGRRGTGGGGGSGAGGGGGGTGDGDDNRPGDGSGGVGGDGTGGNGDTPPWGDPGEDPDDDALAAWLARGEDPAGAMAALLMPTEGQAAEETSVLPGRVIAVWGTPGAPGRTTIAANLAAELAALATSSRNTARRGGAGLGDLPRRHRRDGETLRGDGRPILLIDGDTEAPCMAQVLGMLEESSALAALARRASHGRLTSAGLLRTSPPLRPGLHVASGLSRADRWREVPTTAFQEVLRVARSAAQLTVLDLGAGAEEPPPGLDAWGAPPRHGVTRAALAEADVVLVVGAADPVGVRRLVDALTTLRDQALAPVAQVFPVVTKLRASAVGPDPAQSVLAALETYADVSQAIVVPDDRAAFDACLLQGRVLAEAAPKSGARTPLAEFARWLLPELGAPVAA